MSFKNMRGGPVIIIAVMAGASLVAGNFAPFVYATGTQYPPIVHISADSQSIPYGGSAVLTWTSSNATACNAVGNATGGWTGSKPLSGSQAVTPRVTTRFVIICSNSNFEKSDSVVVEVRPQDPPTITLTANPVNITSGGTSLLTWTSTNADYCTTYGGWTGEVTRSGNRTVSPTNYTEYTIICTNSARQVSARTAIDVLVSPPPTLSLTASPQTIFQGNPSILSWSSANATNCYATAGWSGNKALSGSETFAPGQTTSYGLTCTGPGGTVSANTVINVNQTPQVQLPTVTISSNPSNITPGNSSILNWSSSNANYCYASGGWSGNVSLSGSQSVTPANTTAYQITCANSSGQTTAQTTTFVNNPPQIQLPTVTISSNPPIINFGQTSLLNWSSSNANYCYASGGWSGNAPLSSSQNVSPSISTTYVITCVNSSGQASAQTTVYVNNQQPLTPTTNLNALPDTINRGQTALLIWSSTNATQCYASGGWTGAKTLSGSEIVSPAVNTTYSLSCGNSSGQTVNTDTIFVNNILFESPTLIPPFNAACVISPSITQVNRTVTIAAGQSGGSAPYSYSWSGDISGTGAVKSFIFSTTGIKTVRLMVTDRTGKTAEATCRTQVSPAVITTPPPTPPSAITVSTPPPPLCRTYLACSDGQTYEVGALGGNRTTLVPANPNNLIYNSGTSSGPVAESNQSQLPQTQVAGQNQTENSMLASLFTSKDGAPSRFTFLVVWYIFILFFVGFIALVYSAILKSRT